MMIPPQIAGLARGLILHFLQGKTVDQAIAQGREVGMPDELLDSLPGMMFQAVSAAGAVHLGERTMQQVLETLAKRGAPTDEAEYLVQFALDVITALEAEGGPYAPVPTSDKKWFEYDRT